MRALPHNCLSITFSLCLAALSATPAFGADDWTQEGQSANGSSFNAAQSGIGPAQLPVLEQRWARDLDVWGQSTGVAIADGQVYVNRRVDDPDTTVRSQIVRLDLQSGRTVWKTNAPESYATPVLSPDLVIVGGTGLETGFKKTFVRAYARDTGERRWHYVLPGRANTVRSPHLKDGVVYVSGEAGDVAALDAENGLPRWEARFEIGCCGFHGLAVDDGTVVLSYNQGLVALDATDGHERWRYQVTGNYFVSERPMIVNGMAFAFDGGGLVHAVDLATGALRWQQLAPYGDMAHALDSLASDGQRVFVLSGLVRPMLSALDIATGTPLWRQKPSGGWGHGLVASNGVLYVATLHNVLAYDAATGELLPIAKLRSSRTGPLAIAQGHLIIGGGPVRAYGVPEER